MEIDKLKKKEEKWEWRLGGEVYKFKFWINLYIMCGLGGFWDRSRWGETVTWLVCIRRGGYLPRRISITWRLRGLRLMGHVLILHGPTFLLVSYFTSSHSDFHQISFYPFLISFLNSYAFKGYLIRTLPNSLHLFIY